MQPIMTILEVLLTQVKYRNS